MNRIFPHVQQVIDQQTLRRRIPNLTRKNYILIERWYDELRYVYLRAFLKTFTAKVTW